MHPIKLTVTAFFTNLGTKTENINYHLLILSVETVKTLLEF